MQTDTNFIWIVTLISALLFSCTHLFTYKLKFLNVFPRSKWLSFAGGVSIAYIFVHLLPELEEMQHTFIKTDHQLNSFFDYPLYVVALFSLSIYYGVERQVKLSGISNKTEKKPEVNHKEAVGIF